MVATGTSASSGEAIGVARGTGGWAVARGASYEQSTQCGRPTTVDERCEVAAGNAWLGVAGDYNAGWRRLVTAAGYLAFIVPGVIASISFNSERDGIINRADAAARDAYQQCMGDEHSVASRLPVASDPSGREAVGDEPDDKPATVSNPSDRKIVYGDQLMFCSASAAICSVDHAACTAADCAEATAASCFNYVTALDDKRGLLCAPSIGACETVLARFKTLPDYKVTAKQCGIYRQREGAVGSDEGSDE
jgi:hypothetical protein